jgi:teichuronic acid biosynthesis glycosyltransferase TuaC
MKVLFIYSGNSKYFPISPFTKAQADSLTDKGLQVEFFPLTGKGFKNYFKNIFLLRRHLKQNKYNLLHAHYNLCGWVAVLASRKTPVVLSLMGDDAQGTFTGKNKINLSSYFFISLTYCIQPFVKAIISKSPKIEKVVYRKKISYIIPNGVVLNNFFINENGFREELGLQKEKKYLLFLASPTDTNKNFVLAQKAVELLNRNDIELINIYKANPEVVVKYLNSADVLVHCSFAEGSANVIKEAMACNCPMVITNAGDAAWVAGNTAGCFISGYDPAVFANDISKALEFVKENKRTKGRERILELGLDSGTVAEKIIAVYKKILKAN